MCDWTQARQARDRWRECRCLDMHTDILTALDVGKYGRVILSLNVDEPLTPLSLCLSFLFSALSLFLFFNLCYIHTRLILLVCRNRLIFYISLNIQNKFSIFDTFIHIQIQ